MKEILSVLYRLLAEAEPAQADVEQFVSQVKNGNLDLGIAAALLRYQSEIMGELVDQAKAENLARYRKQMEFYTICYVSDRCVNSCRYCGLQRSLAGYRSQLDYAHLREDLKAALRHGPTDVCILAGEHPSLTVDYLAIAANTALDMDVNRGLDRITFNVAPLTALGFRQLRQKIAFPLQYRIFQESYDADVYAANHLAGPKRNFLFRLTAQERALAEGFDHVGIGALLGLNNRHDLYPGCGHDFEILALITHAQHLRARFGQWPYSLSIPRHQPIPEHAFATPSPVDDRRYLAYHAILRLALPETKLILTAREPAELRSEFRPLINIEDLEARPWVGGNSTPSGVMQNELQDTRSAEEIIANLRAQGFIPVIKER